MSDTRKVAEQIAKEARKLFGRAYGPNGWTHTERSLANMIVGAVETALTAELVEAKRLLERLRGQVEFSLKHWPDCWTMGLDEATSDAAAFLAKSPAPQSREPVADEDCGKAGDRGDDAMDALNMLDWFRQQGWMVAVHNDYRQHDRLNTFWLLTHPNGRWVKGEGVSDALALDSAMCDALTASPAPPASDVGEIVAWFRMDNKDDRSPCWRFLLEQDSAKGIADAIEAGDFRPAKAKSE